MSKKHQCPHCGKTWVMKIGRPRTIDFARCKSMYDQGFTISEISRIMRISAGSAHKGIHHPSDGGSR